MFFFNEREVVVIAGKVSLFSNPGNIKRVYPDRCETTAYQTNSLKNTDKISLLQNGEYDRELSNRR